MVMCGCFDVVGGWPRRAMMAVGGRSYSRRLYNDKPALKMSPAAVAGIFLLIFPINVYSAHFCRAGLPSSLLAPQTRQMMYTLDRSIKVSHTVIIIIALECRYIITKDHRRREEEDHGDDAETHTVSSSRPAVCRSQL